MDITNEKIDDGKAFDWGRVYRKNCQGYSYKGYKLQY